MALFPLITFADEVEIDGIYYNLIKKIKQAEVIKNPNKYTGSITIPESVTYNNVDCSVTSIGNDAFSGCSGLTSVTIGNSVTSIGTNAFSGCSGLTAITIPHSVTSIGNDAFSGCSGLTSVTISDIGAWCNISFNTWYSNPLYVAHHLFLNGEEIRDLVIPNSVTSIGNDAFSGCSGLTSVTIPHSVTNIGNDAFISCSGLTSVTIPNSVKRIGYSAFENCSGLTSVTIPNSVTYIAGGVFSGCSGLTSVTIPNSVTEIRDWAFFGCSGLTSVTIPNSVTYIGEGVFYGCSGLTSVTIGNGINSIGGRAFAYCPEIIDVYCYAQNVPTTSSDAFQNSDIEYATLHVPSNPVNAYKAKEPWKNFKSIVALTDEDPKPTGISSVINLTSEIDATVYDLNGRRIATPKRGGLNIIRMKDGTTRKILKK